MTSLGRAASAAVALRAGLLVRVPDASSLLKAVRGDAATPRGDAASRSVDFWSCSTWALGLYSYLLPAVVLLSADPDANELYLRVPYVVAALLPVVTDELLHRASRCARCSRSRASRSSALAGRADASVDAIGRDASAEVNVLVPRAAPLAPNVPPYLTVP